MDKWTILAYFLLSIGLFELSGKQLYNMETDLKGQITLTSWAYNFWLILNLASIALGLDMLHRLLKVGVTVDLNMEHTKEHKEEK